ncbi:MAG: sugar phosphate nucleotidyltransferase [Candidatus Omnitrophota bacterium]
MSKHVKALILGGGQGKRLFPLTKYRSKPAVPIGGKYRLIDIPISNCLHSQLKDIFVLTQFNSESLNNHINNTYRFDFFSTVFVRILAAEQTLDNTNWFQGTADAVRRNLNHLDLEDDSDVLILSGDQLYRMDYRKLIQFHRKTRADLTVSAVPVASRDARDFGILSLDKRARIVNFREKPKERLSRSPCLASMGVYIFKARALIKALKGDHKDFGHEVIPRSIARFKSYGYIFDGYWRDIGTIKTFYKMHIEFTVKQPLFSFFLDDAIFTRPRFLPPAKLHDSKISDCLLAEGCVINGAAIKRSVVGLRTMIGKRCRISNTVIMGADYYEQGKPSRKPEVGISDGTVIDRAIIDKNARVGRNVVIRNVKKLVDHDGENYYIRNGIVIIPKNAVIPDGTRI